MSEDILWMGSLTKLAKKNSFHVIRMGFKKKTMNLIWNNIYTFWLKSKTNPTQKFDFFSSICIKITTEPIENEKPKSILSLFE